MPVSLLDWILVALVVLLAVRGFSSGFVAGAFSLAGLGIGAYLGGRLATYLVQAEAEFAAYGPLVLLLSALLFAGIGRAIAGAIGDKIGSSIRRVPVLGTLDGAFGAVLGAAVGLLFVWVLGIFTLQTPLPAQLQGPVERSEVLGEVNERLPSGLLLDTIARLDPLPRIEGPAPQVDEPEAPSPAGVEAAAPSVVRVVGASGSGYGSGSSGSGWVAAPGLVVTNAHVIEGNDYLAVQQEGAWRRYEAEAVSVDGRNDVAVLAVDGLDLPALPLAEPAAGEPVAILGYPHGGPLDVGAARIGGTSQILSRDAYGDGPVSREVTAIRGEANPGNSGGPVVNGNGEVVATVFGAGSGYAEVAYAIPSWIIQQQLDTVQGGVAAVPRHTEARVA